MGHKFYQYAAVGNHELTRRATQSKSLLTQELGFRLLECQPAVEDLKALQEYVDDLEKIRDGLDLKIFDLEKSLQQVLR